MSGEGAKVEEEREDLIAKAMMAIEAILLVAPEPVTFGELKGAMDFASSKDLREALERLQANYATKGIGFTLREVAGGYQFATRPELAPFIRKVFEDKRQRRLSRAAFETLAVIAYKQPATRAEVEAVRGVNVSGTLQSLLEKELVRVTGRKEGAGKPLLYGTTDKFLKLFGLMSVDDLPKEEEFK